MDATPAVPETPPARPVPVPPPEVMAAVAELPATSPAKLAALWDLLLPHLRRQAKRRESTLPKGARAGLALVLPKIEEAVAELDESQKEELDEFLTTLIYVAATFRSADAGAILIRGDAVQLAVARGDCDSPRLAIGAPIGVEEILERGSALFGSDPGDWQDWLRQVDAGVDGGGSPQAPAPADRSDGV